MDGDDEDYEMLCVIRGEGEVRISENGDVSKTC